jgi:proton-dependent oligopeptide transporter, POT family
MAAGHGLLAFEPALLPALVAIALGAGFFKGPAAAQLSALYAPLDAARVEGFRLFYIAINLAGLLAPLIIGTVGERVHWHAGFAMSCLGMLTGLAIYRWRFAGPGLKEPVSDGADSVPPPLARGDAAILSILGVSTALLVVPNFQITNAYLLWVDRSFDLSLFGWRMPSSWIIAVDGALSLAALYGSLLFWRSWDHAHGTSPPLRKALAGAVVVVAGSLCLALAARLHGETAVPIGWGLAFQLLNSIGLANVLPAVMALFGQFSTRRYAATSMTMFYLSLFAGGLTSTALASQYAVLGPLPFWLLHSGAAAAGMGGLIIVALGRIRIKHDLKCLVTATDY